MTTLDFIKHSKFIIQNYNMQVWKFGGTSVGKPERMHSIRELLNSDPSRKIVVLSALSGSTNALIAIGEAAKAFDDAKAAALIEDLRTHYGLFIKELYATPDRPGEWSDDRGQ
jgi:aspartate kinase